MAERKHHHLLETARPLMVTASLPSHFWAKTVSTSIYLINLQQSTALKGGASFEHLFDRFLIIRCFNYLVVFCYVLLAPRECTKLTAQSLACVFLGYNDEHKGYRYWDYVGLRIPISRG